MTILIVDDSRGMRMIIKRAFRQAGLDGHDLVEAGSGPEALSILRSTTVDFVLTDWNMPEMSGVEMIETMIAEGIEVGVGVVSSRSSAEMLRRAREAGARFLLTKPFTPDVFRSALTPILG